MDLDTTRPLVLLVMAAVSLTLTAAACSGGEAPPANSKVAFVSDRDPGGIWLMNADGSDPTFVGVGVDPAWSPDGQAVIFRRRTPDGNLDLFIMDATGSSVQSLTSGPGNDAHPAWSPDGQWIAFASDPEGNQDIYVIGRDGSGLTRLTTSAAADLSPHWSPDGSKIAFSSVRDDNHEIYSMNADGSEQLRLTTDAERDDNPAWSPDGRQIAFDSHRTGLTQIFVMEADGSDVRQLTDDFSSLGPVWSPNGQWIAVSRDVLGANVSNPEVLLVQANGSSEIRLTERPGVDTVFAWFSTD